MSVKESLINVEIAFKQLEFSIKLMCYCENGHLSKNEFDTDVLILLEQENRSFLANNFSDYKKEKEKEKGVKSPLDCIRK